MPLGWLRRKWRRRRDKPAGDAAAASTTATSPRDSVDLGERPRTRPPARLHPPPRRRRRGGAPRQRRAPRCRGHRTSTTGCRSAAGVQVGADALASPPRRRRRRRRRRARRRPSRSRAGARRTTRRITGITGDLLRTGCSVLQLPTCYFFFIFVFVFVSVWSGTPIMGVAATTPNRDRNEFDAITLFPVR